MEKDVKKEYTNGEITVVWQPSVCIHSTICWKKATGLPEVFKPAEKPWVKMEGAKSQEIAAQVDKCPSGALSWYRNSDGKPAETAVDNVIEITENGPLLVYGNLKIKSKEGEEIRKSKVTAFCRCGHSGNKPYCDGSHIKAGFKA